MISLLLAAAISQPLWFDNQHNGQLYVVTPMVHLQTECQCDYRLKMLKTGISGTSTSVQQSAVTIAANTDVALTRISFNLQQGDSVQIYLSLNDGKQVSLENTLNLPK